MIMQSSFLDEANNSDFSSRKGLRIDLFVCDTDVLAALQSQPDQAATESLALAALKVGVLAIRQASGAIDSRTIQKEADDLLANLKAAMNEQASLVRNTLHQYFDPSNGQFNQRIERLVGRDGDLEKVIEANLTGEHSTLHQILRNNLGENSPLLQRFSPDERTGIIAAIREKLQASLDQHAKAVVEQFSLDKPDSAISRMLQTITEKNGSLREHLAGDLGKVRDEFSLDKENSAINRLMGQISSANNKIKDEFSLNNTDSALSRLSRLLESTKGSINDNLSMDRKDSPLSRLRDELTALIEKMEKGQNEFQKNVGEAISAMNARRQESMRSAAHGQKFEAQLGEYLNNLVSGLGDHLEHVGGKAGKLPRCKVGDHVITLADTSASPGCKIVLEAKEDKSYSLTSAFDEIETARQNRDAEAGIFVFSAKTAPVGMQPIERKDRDIVVRWDSDDITTDIVLRTAVLVSRFLVVQRKREENANKVEFQKMVKSVEALERGVRHIDAIIRSGNTIKNSSDSILKEAGKAKVLHEEELNELKKLLDSFGDSSAPIEV